MSITVGLPKEVQDHEHRVALTPAGARELARVGARVVFEPGAGAGSGFGDEDYAAAQATRAGSAAEVWSAADLVVKVKEPVEREFQFLREGLMLFAYLHTPPRPALTQQLLQRGVTAIAYENILDPDGRRPLLAPMSEIAGKMSVLLAAQYSQKLHGGPGVLLARVAGLAPAVVVVLGGGVAGMAAARTAAALGNEVYLLELLPARVRELSDHLPPGVKVMHASREHVARLVPNADVVINCTSWPNPTGEHIITRAMLSRMKPSAAIVDVSCDPKGSVETCEYRTHSDPTYVVDGIVHYCVPNIPGIVPRTATLALTALTLSYTVRLAAEGAVAALGRDEGFLQGLSTHAGSLTDPETAHAQGLACVDRRDALAGGEAGRA